MKHGGRVWGRVAIPTRDKGGKRGNRYRCRFDPENMTDAELRVRIVELDALLRIDEEPAADEPSQLVANPVDAVRLMSKSRAPVIVRWNTPFVGGHGQ